MSFDPFQPHPAMRVHPTDLSPGMQYNTSETGVDDGSCSYNTPNFGPLHQSTGSAQTQLPNVAAHILQTRVMPPYIYEQNPGGATSMDPFTDATQMVGPTSFGVLRIRNIPYEVLAKEIVHFLGRNPNMIDNHIMGCAVHLIMERPTSKTMDCFVEFQSQESVRDQISRYENMAQSGRLPKIGNRHVHVEESNQDELLAEMFPRAKSIIWQQGDPVVIENEDPYSTGFNGFFTSEEMVGLVRHAEVPNRSPFSQNCLQRTYECMISTLYKFPWYAPELYTLADRNVLFTTYMSQMKVLVDKVENTDTKGLDENLLRDFIFAGMNCPGFGERQKHHLITAAGYWGSAVSISSLCCFWPFDLISRKHGMDDDTVKSFLDLMELGVKAFPNGVPLKEHFIVQPPNTTIVRPEHPYFLNNTRFEFNEESQRLDYGTAMGIEMKLMRELLSAAYASLREQNYPFQEGGAANSYAQLAENLRMLNQQEQEILQGGNDNESTPRAQLTPAQSPKGTPATVTNEGGHGTMTPTEKKSKYVDPTSKPFEPRRRLSEPQHATDMIGGSPMHSGYHRRSSSTLSLPFPDDTPPTITPRKPVEYVTPTKSKRGGRVSVDHTIHEEEDEALVMAANPAKQQNP